MGQIRYVMAQIDRERKELPFGFRQLKDIVLHGDTRLIELALSMVKLIWGTLALGTMLPWGVGMLVIGMIQCFALMKGYRRVRMVATLTASLLWGWMAYVLTSSGEPGVYLLSFVVLINLVLGWRLGRSTSSG